jgi:hypothetical protein
MIRYTFLAIAGWLLDACRPTPKPKPAISHPRVNAKGARGWQ